MVSSLFSFLRAGTKIHHTGTKRRSSTIHVFKPTNTPTSERKTNREAFTSVFRARTLCWLHRGSRRPRGHLPKRSVKRFRIAWLSNTSVRGRWAVVVDGWDTSARIAWSTCGAGRDHSLTFLRHTALLLLGSRLVWMRSWTRSSDSPESQQTMVMRWTRQSQRLLFFCANAVCD